MCTEHLGLVGTSFAVEDVAAAVAGGVEFLEFALVETFEQEDEQQQLVVLLETVVVVLHLLRHVAA